TNPNYFGMPLDADHGVLRHGAEVVMGNFIVGDLAAARGHRVKSQVFMQAHVSMFTSVRRHLERTIRLGFPFDLFITPIRPDYACAGASVHTLPEGPRRRIFASDRIMNNPV